MLSATHYTKKKKKNKRGENKNTDNKAKNKKNKKYKFFLFSRQHMKINTFLLPALDSNLDKPALSLSFSAQRDISRRHFQGIPVLYSANILSYYVATMCLNPDGDI